ncbi:hypothetical protein D3C85_1609880 [compost metagenome]
MNRREVQHVETHVLDHREPRLHIIEGAVAGRIVGDRAGEQLIPTGELREFTLHVQRVFRAKADEGVMIGPRHEVGATLVQKQRDLLGFEQA